MDLCLTHGGSGVQLNLRDTRPSMAQIHVQPPELFNFKQPNEWSCWRRRFEQFHTASGLNADPELKQVSIFLYCMGEEAEVVLAVCQKFDDFFTLFLRGRDSTEGTC